MERGEMLGAERPVVSDFWLHQLLICGCDIWPLRTSVFLFVKWASLQEFSPQSSLSVSSVTQLFPTLCDPMDCSTQGFPVHQQLPEVTQNHVHRVSDAIQPSHPLSSPSPPAPNPLPASGSFPMSQLFTWGGQSIGVSASSSVVPMNTQDWSPLGWTGWTSLQSRGLSRVFSNTTIQKHRFFGAQLSSQSNSHIHTWPLGSIKSRCEKGKIKFLLASRFSISFSWIAGDEFWNLLFLWMTFPCLVNISLGIFCLILR